MKNRTKRRRKSNKTRICLGMNEKTGEKGPSWLVATSDGKQKVRADGTLGHALEGLPGKSMGCTISVCLYSEENRGHFPHPVLWLPHVNKTNVFVVDKMRDGQPTHAVRYRHYLGNIVDLNDTDPSKEVFKEHPDLIERPITLYPPRRRRVGETKTGGGMGTHDHSRTPFSLKGSVRRAMVAGLLSAETGQVLEKMGIE